MASHAIGRQVREFTQARFKKALLGSRVLSKSAEGWTSAARKTGIFFDLSRAEWIDLGVAAEILILTESAVRQDVPVSVALPLPHLRQSELAFLATNPPVELSRGLGYRVAGRQRVRGYLDYLGFTSALALSHLSEQAERPAIHPAYDESDLEEPELSASEAVDNTRIPAALIVDQMSLDGSNLGPLYRNTYPFTWINGSLDQDIVLWEEFLGRVIGSSERGLATVDAATLSNVVLYELVDNVARHAESGGFALVGAAARLPSRFFHASDWLPSCRPFYEWQNELATPTVDIIVADSGQGIRKSLWTGYEDAKPHGQSAKDAGNGRIVEWAWDRWSTSEPMPGKRGTRGLYRVGRIVRRYGGLVSARTEDLLVGFDYGTRPPSPAFSEREQLPFFPGTLLRITMPTQRATADWAPNPGEIESPNGYSVHLLGSIEEYGLSQATESYLRDALRKAELTDTLVVGVFDGGDIRGVESALRTAADLRDPPALVLMGLPGTWDEVGLSADAVSSEFEKFQRGNESLAPDHFEIWDAIPILSATSEAHWVAGSSDQRTILEALFAAPNHQLGREAIVNEVGSAEASEIAVTRLAHDSKLLRHTEGDGLALRFSYDGILEAVKLELANRLRAHIAGGGDGVLAKNIYLTPSLEYVNRWIRSGDAIAACCGTELVSIVLARLFWSASNGGSVDVLLTDPATPEALFRRVMQHLSITKYELAPSETRRRFPHGVRILPKGSRVLVLLDVLMSGDSARRALGEILRDEARPTAVLCVIDGRDQQTNTLEIWGQSISLFAVTNVAIQETARPTKAVPIDPITRRPDVSVPLTSENEPLTVSLDSVTSSRAFQRLLVQVTASADAMRLSHVENLVGSHFTFVLDPHPIIGSAIDEIGRIMLDQINSWRGAGDSLPTKTLEVWYAHPDARGSALRTTGQWLEQAAPDIIKIRSILRRPGPKPGTWRCSDTPVELEGCEDVVILDWGALSGITMSQLAHLAAISGAKRVMGCILISQMPPDQERFFAQISQLKETVLEKERLTQRQLFRDDSEKSVQQVIDIDFRFLGRLPIRSYVPQDCPVCEQLRSLPEDEPPLRLFREYLANRKQESSPRSFAVAAEERKRAEELEYTPADLQWMLGFRECLEQAVGSTRIRRAIADAIRSWESELGRHDAEVAAASDGGDLTVSGDASGAEARKIVRCLFRFLWTESQWLHMPPLQLRRLRDPLSRLALREAIRTENSANERRNALAVLRASNKELFGDKLNLLFQSTQDSLMLQSQLLFDAYTYSIRSYHNAGTFLQTMLTSLSRIATHVRGGHLAVTIEVADAVSYLRDRVELKTAKASVTDLNQAEAWLELKRYFRSLEPHSTEVEASQKLRLATFERSALEWMIHSSESTDAIHDQLGQTFPRDHRKYLESNWTECAAALDTRILPLLGTAQRALLAEDTRVAIDRAALAWIRNRVNEAEAGHPLSASTFGSIMQDFKRNAEVILKEENATIYVRETEALWNYVFRVSRPSSGTTALNRSALSDVLDRMPADLWSAFHEAYESCKFRLAREPAASSRTLPEDVELSSPDRQQLLVFCPKRLLLAAIQQLLGNVGKHHIRNSGICRIETTISRANGRIFFQILNDKSEKKTKSGSGFSLFQDRLKSYDAFLRPVSPPAWASYGVEISLLEMGEE